MKSLLSSPFCVRIRASLLSIRVLFVFLCFFLVALGCSMVWLVNYRASETIVDNLTSQLRREALFHAIDKLSLTLNGPLRAATTLAVAAPFQYPVFNSRTDPASIDPLQDPFNTTGFMYPFELTLSTFPLIQSVGMIAENQYTIAFQRNTFSQGQYTLSRGIRSSLNSTEFFYYNYSTIARKAVSNDDAWFDVPLLSRYDTPKDELLAQLSFIGKSPTFLDVHTRPIYQRALQLDGVVGWTPIYRSAGLVPVLALSAVKLIDPGSRNQSQLPVRAAVSASVFLSTLDDELKTLDIGKSGIALVISAGGLLIGASRPQYSTEVSSRVTGQEFVQTVGSSIELLRSVSAALIEGGIMPHNYQAYQSVGASTVPAYCRTAASRTIVQDLSVSVGSSDYKLHASSLCTNALDFIVVILTNNADYRSTINAAIRESVISSAVILVATILLGFFLIEFLFLSPLKQTVRGMKELAKIAAITDQGEEKRELHRIVKKWKQISGENPLDAQYDEPSVSSSEPSGSGPSVSKSSASSRRSGGAAIQSLFSPPASATPFSPGSASSPSSPSSPSSGSSSGSSTAAVPSRSPFCFRFTRPSVCEIRSGLFEVRLLQRGFFQMLASLIRSNSERELAESSKTRFIRYIFHEVRIPLNSVLLGIQYFDVLLGKLTTIVLKAQDGGASAGTQTLPNSGSNSSNSELASGTVPQLTSTGSLHRTHSETPSRLDSASASQLAEECQELLSILKDQSQTVVRILNDVLSLQRIESGALSLEMAPFNWDDLVYPTLHQFSSAASKERLIVFETQIQSLDQFVEGQRIKQREERDRRVSIIQGTNEVIFHLDDEKSDSQTIEMEPLKNNRRNSTDNNAKNETLKAPPRSSSESGFAPAVHPPAGLPHSQSHSASELPKPAAPTPALASAAGSEPLASPSSTGSSVSFYSVLGDRYRVNQIYSNFLSNAIKFSPPHAKIITRLSIQPHPDDPDSALFRLSVRDHGVGLTPEESTLLFNPYQQLSAGNQQHLGSGLGLSICKLLAELHGGKVGVHSSRDTESEFGCGSEFWVELPMKIVAKTPSEMNAATAAAMHSRQLQNSEQAREDANKAAEAAAPVPLVLTPSPRNAAVAGLLVSSVGGALIPSLPGTDTGTVTPSSLPARGSHSNFSQAPHQVYDESSFATLQFFKPVDGAIILPQTGELTRIATEPAVNQSQFRFRNAPIMAFDDTSPRHNANTNTNNNRKPEGLQPNGTINHEHSAVSDHPAVIELPPAETLKVMRSSPPAPEINVIQAAAARALKPVDKPQQSVEPEKSVESTPAGSPVISPSSSTTPAPSATLNPAPRILIAEDHMASRKLLQRILQNFGCEVIAVEDGMQAMQVVLEEKQHFDLIYLDNIMPQLSGVETCQRLRAGGIVVPICAVTGNALLEDIELFKRAGINELFTKPVSRDQIRVSLKTWIPKEFQSALNI